MSESSESVLTGVAYSLHLAVFQVNEAGKLVLRSRPPDWLRQTWLPAATAGAELCAKRSPFLENFLVDAANCWRSGPQYRVSSGPWVEKDRSGNERHLQATALTAAGCATLLIEELGQVFDERRSIVQKAHEAALAYERLQKAEQALAEEKQLLEQRVRERTAELSRANDELTREIATRRQYGERLLTMYDLNKSILAAASPEDIAVAALRRVPQLLPCEQAHVIELDADYRHGTILASLQNRAVTAGGGATITREALRYLTSLPAGQVHRAEGAINLWSRAAGPDAQSPVWALLVDLPLVADGTLVGVLNLASNTPQAFSSEHETIALEFAAQLAVAIRQARLFSQVSAAGEQLRALSLRLVEVQEAERRFLARELHDEIGQVLTGLKLSLQMSLRAWPAETSAGLTEALGLLDELMQQVRQLSLDLRPQMLDDFGLLPALEWQFKRYGTQTGIHVQFKHSPLPKQLAGQLETAVFRVVQEALTNVARHAKVREATVRLWTDGQRLGVQVEDAGAGFDAERALTERASTGLSGMKERAELLGGQLTLDTQPGQGTRLTVELPLMDALSSKPSTPPAERAK